MKGYFSYIKSLDPEVKRNSIFLFFTYFFILFTYPFTRSATQVLFLESYSAKDFPFTWFLSIVTLSVTIYICNKIQNKIGVHKLFSFVCMFSIAVFSVGLWLYQLGIPLMAYPLYIWKEVYIVILIHLFLAFCNGYYTLDQMKFLYGPIGAMGSLGGIIGGQLTSLLAKTTGTDSILYVSFLLLLFSFISFQKTRKISLREQEEENKDKPSPLEAIKDVRGYVFLIASLVALSQFVINICDFQFNIIFEQTVSAKDDRTFYLGQLYSIINMVSLVIQFVLLPYILRKIKIQTGHYFVPVFYLALIIFAFSFGGGLLWPIAIVFVGMKANDYSLFAVIKELLYHPLDNLQKYGAKYVTDMLTYRVAKAVIALLLMAVNSLVMVTSLQVGFILLWFICVVFIFRKIKTLGVENESIT